MPSPVLTTVAQPRRRWFQFSLRTLFAVVTLAAIAMGMVVIRIVTLSERQKQAVAYVKSLGGIVVYAGEPEPSWIRAPDWLRTFLGNDYFKSVKTVHLSETQITDAGLAHLQGLAVLQELFLSNTKVTEAGLTHLRGLTRIEVLELSGTQITDVSLAHLHGLTALRRLTLCKTQITDAGLAHLRGLTAIEVLNLSGTQITDEGLAHLYGLTKLNMLDLYNTKVTDAYGVGTLQAALPNCHIEWSPRSPRTP